MKKPLIFFLFLVGFPAFGQMRWHRLLDYGPWGIFILYHTSLTYNNKMWVIGGLRGDGDTIRGKVYYSSDGINWFCATESAPWRLRLDHTSVVFNNKMWVIGGEKLHHHCMNDVWYSSDGINWFCATESAPWQPTFWHSSVVFDNKIWVIIGTQPGAVWYSSDGINWTCALDSAPWGPRGWHASVVFKNKIWVIGGYAARGDTAHNVNDVWYSSDGINWFCATESAGWKPREEHTALVFRDTIWILGGRLDLMGPNDTIYDDVWYSSDGINWFCATESAGWGGRCFHASTVYNDRLWLIGGYQRGYRFSGDVWYSTGLEAIKESTFLGQSTNKIPTIISNLSPFQISEPASLFSPIGRRIATLKCGRNNIRLKPGIYFLRRTKGEKFVIKLVITH